MEDEVVPRDMLALDNAIFYVELGAKCNADMQTEMLEMMRILKAYLEILKADNIKLNEFQIRSRRDK